MDKESNCKKENLYKNRDPRNYYFDGDPRAFYWYKYRLTHFFLKDHFNCGEKINNPVWIENEIPEDIVLKKCEIYENSYLYDIPIVIVGNSNLNPFIFDIRKKDRAEINEFKLPGKSATIAFSWNLAETCGAIFDRDCRRQDNLYIARITEIEQCNYSVYYAPTPNQPLHVRLVNKVHESDLNAHVPPFKDRECLTETFTQGKSL